MDWFNDAACTGHNTDLWFPRTNTPNPRLEAAPKAICAECPVTGECLSYALANGEQGIWGGLNDEERHDLPRQRARTISVRNSNRVLKPIEHGTPAGYAAHYRRGIPPCDDCKAANRAVSQMLAAQRAAS